MEDEIFRNGSTTYYWSSKFFPPNIRDDVFRFYSFVRVVDDYVDKPIPDKKAFEAIRQLWQGAIADEGFSTNQQADDSVDLRVVKNMVFIMQKYDCPKEWIEAFFRSMDWDIERRKYKTTSDTLEYIYGSAEVIGLVMSKIMGLPTEAQTFAKMQGRAMQFVNFIRDVREDNELGRQYFPAETLQKYDLKNLTQIEAKKNPENFAQFMRSQIRLYQEWQQEAAKGFRYIPRRLRIPLRTAVDMYNWTAKQIEKDPLIVLSKKIKPSKRQVLLTAIKRSLWA